MFIINSLVNIIEIFFSKNIFSFRNIYELKYNVEFFWQLKIIANSTIKLIYKKLYETARARIEYNLDSANTKHDLSTLYLIEYF